MVSFFALRLIGPSLISVAARHETRFGPEGGFGKAKPDEDEVEGGEGGDSSVATGADIGRRRNSITLDVGTEDFLISALSTWIFWSGEASAPPSAPWA